MGGRWVVARKKEGEGNSGNKGDHKNRVRVEGCKKVQRCISEST